MDRFLVDLAQLDGGDQVVLVLFTARRGLLIELVQSGAASGHRAILDLMSHVISGSMSVVCMHVVKERAPRSCCVRPSVLPSELPLLPLLVRGVNRVAWYCSRCRASLRVPSGPSERSFYVLYSGLGYGLMHAKTPRGTARSPLSSEVFPIIVMSG